jgi:hypothetical protein
MTKSGDLKMIITCIPKKWWSLKEWRIARNTEQLYGYYLLSSREDKIRDLNMEKCFNELMQDSALKSITKRL